MLSVFLVILQLIITIDTPANVSDYSIEDISHPEHEAWLNREIEWLKQYDNFKELEL